MQRFSSYSRFIKSKVMAHLARTEENAFGSKQAARRSSVSSLSLIDAERIKRMTHFSTNIPNGRVVLLQKWYRVELF